MQMNKEWEREFERQQKLRDQLRDLELEQLAAEESRKTSAYINPILKKGNFAFYAGSLLAFGSEMFYLANPNAIGLSGLVLTTVGALGLGVTSKWVAEKKAVNYVIGRINTAIQSLQEEMEGFCGLTEDLAEIGDNLEIVEHHIRESEASQQRGTKYYLS